MTENGDVGHANNFILDSKSETEGVEDAIPTATLSNFIKAKRMGTYLTDKSVLIERILSRPGGDILLFCRPRRFGKTINLTMLDAFLNVEYAGNDLFDGMEISRNGRFDGLKNSFPVIYLDFIDISVSSYRALEDSCGTLIRNAFGKHHYLSESHRLSDFQKSQWHRVAMEGDVKPGDLKLLTDLLHAHHGTETVVLIDEYDTPILEMLGKDGYGQTVELMRDILAPLLKNNPHVFKAVIAGVVRLSKESIFSHLNNLLVSSVLNPRGFDECFGLTPEDVRSICEEAGHPESYDELMENYDGYSIGEARITNPYSVMNYFDNDLTPLNYWCRTSKEDIIAVLLSMGDQKVHEIITDLLSGKSVEVDMDDNLSLPPDGDIRNMEPDDAFNLLTQSGYLTASHIKGNRYSVRIPNLELKDEFRKRARKWLGKARETAVNRIFDALMHGRPEEAVDDIAKLFTESLDDRSKALWSSHQLILTGFLACQDTHVVRAEHHSGDGVTDISAFPRGTGAAFVVEFNKVSDDGGLHETADHALRQISRKRYALGMKGEPVRTYGIAVGKDGIAITDGSTVSVARTDGPDR